MAAYVRVKDRAELRRHVQAVGRQIDVAARAGLAPQRLNQLLTGVAPRIEADAAARLERVLGVTPNTLFGIPEEEKATLRPYMAGDEGDSGESGPDEVAPNPIDTPATSTPE